MTRQTTTSTAVMRALGEAARGAAVSLAVASTDMKNAALTAGAETIRASASEILAANDKDMDTAQGRDLSAALLDRLELDDARVEGMAKGLEEVAALPDPVGAVMAQWSRPNGLEIARVRVPLGGYRDYLRIAAQRHRRCRGYLPEVWQRSHPARRVGKFSFLHRHRRMSGAGPRTGGPAQGLYPACAHP